jgi:hypothetical protein
MNFAGKRGRVRGRCKIRHIRGKLHLVSNNNHRLASARTIATRCC